MPNGNANNISWSPDGTYILFNTNQRTEEGQVVRVDLILRTPKFREDRFRDLFKEDHAARDRGRGGAAPERDAEPARDPSTPVEIVFDDIRRRLSILPVGVDVAAQTISPDGRSLLLTATAEGQQNLYIYSLDELAREPAVARQLTSTAGAKADAQFTPDSREVFYLEQGRITVMPVETRVARPVAVTAEIDVDFAQEKMEVFRQAWTYLRDGFYDDKFHGVNWDAVRTQYAPRIAGAQTPDEMRRLLNLMVGELNASHMGVAAGGRGGAGGDGPSVGRLGLRFDRTEYEQAGRLRITEIVPLGPAAITRQVKVGDYLLAVDEVKIAAQTNLDEVLAHCVNRRMALSALRIAGRRPMPKSHRPPRQPGHREEPALSRVGRGQSRLRRKGQRRAARIRAHERHVGGRVAPFLHRSRRRQPHEGRRRHRRPQQQRRVRERLRDRRARPARLSDDDPARLADRAGPQRCSASARSSCRRSSSPTSTRCPTPRTSPKAIARSSSARSWASRPRAGSSTPAARRWSTARPCACPSTRITTLDGKTMELNPRPVDIPVTRPIGESLTGKDSQLDTAVKELLATLTVGSR